jgi:hypothetical protein
LTLQADLRHDELTSIALEVGIAESKSLLWIWLLVILVLWVVQGAQNLLLPVCLEFASISGAVLGLFGVG